jgi:hypothetical protein
LCLRWTGALLLSLCTSQGQWVWLLVVNVAKVSICVLRCCTFSRCADVVFYKQDLLFCLKVWESDTPYGCLLPRESIVVVDLLPSFWAAHELVPTWQTRTLFYFKNKFIQIFSLLEGISRKKLSQNSCWGFGFTPKRKDS